MSCDVVVVGGGVAGLVAARRLALAGLSVRVIERAETFGGQVQPLAVGGGVLDAAAESFATRTDAVATLLGELGLAGDIVTPAAGPAWLHRADGTAVPLPATAVLGIPTRPLAPDVVRAVGLASALRAGIDRVLPARVGADAASLGELVRRRMGRGVVDRLVAPVVRGVHSREADDVPVETAAPDLRALLAERGSLAAAVEARRRSAPAGSQVAGVRGGMFRLVDALVADAERLGIRLDTGVDASPDDVADGELRGERVLWACDPAGDADRRRVTLVTIVVDSPGMDAAPRGTGLLVDSAARGVAARALTHVSAKWAWVADAFPGRHVLRLSYDGEPRDAVAQATADAAVLLGARIDRVDDAAIRVWDRRAAGAAAAGDGDAVGEAVAGTGLASVVAHAERTARALATTIRPASHAAEG